MTVDRKEVEAMAKLVEFFRSSSDFGPEETISDLHEGADTFANADVSDVLPPAIPLSEHPDVIPVAKVGGAGAMYDILSRLNSVGALSETYEAINRVEDIQNVTAAVVHNSVGDRDLRDSIATERTARGARVGSWEIVVNEGEPKAYDVVHVRTQEAIANNLAVYEAALALTNALNDGVGINHHRVQTILRLEEEYSRNREDARRFKHSVMVAEGEGRKAEVSSARYSEARHRAVSAHAALKRLVQTR